MAPVVILIIICIIFGTDTNFASTKYYDVWESKYSHDGASGPCSSNGKYLASIHSTEQNNLLTQMCRDSNDSCWIGLIIAPNNVTWSDGTDVDIQFINNSLCNNLHLNLINTTYFGYINITQDCWGLTSDPSSQFHSTCGPMMFDQNGIYWIVFTIFPCIFSIIIFCYAVYSLRYLIHHLYKRNYNYVDERLVPSKSIKATAITIAILLVTLSVLYFIFSILIYVFYKQTGLFPPIQNIDEYYPDIFKITGIIQIIFISLYAIYFPIGYSHVSYSKFCVPIHMIFK